MPTKSMYLCGVPSASCSGAVRSVSWGTGIKIHGNVSEAYRCHVRWLRSQGYTRVGGREFAAPDGGPVRVLTKRCRFGARLRPGKEGSRHMPSKRDRHGGTIISC